MDVQDWVGWFFVGSLFYGTSSVTRLHSADDLVLSE
jgi:hypothetical protein